MSLIEDRAPPRRSRSLKPTFPFLKSGIQSCSPKAETEKIGKIGVLPGSMVK